MMSHIEELRRSYLPNKVKILFVGESPPHSGDFFYDESLMTTFVSRAFESRFNIEFSDNQEFLNFFKNKECYLEDLSLEPVDGLSPTERKQKLIESIKPLSRRLLDMKPLVVVGILKSIESYIRESIKISGLKVDFYSVPFPGNGWQKKHKLRVLEILKKHM